MIWHKGGARKSWRLRTDFFLVVFLGAVLPLGLVGFWLTRSTQRSAEAYVRMRTEATLGEMARRARLSWELHRSDLLSLAESEEVVQALVSGRRLETGADGGTGSVAVVWERMEGVVDRAVFRSREGEVLAELMRPARSQPGFVEADRRIAVIGQSRRIAALDGEVRVQVDPARDGGGIEGDVEHVGGDLLVAEAQVVAVIGGGQGAGAEAGRQDEGGREGQGIAMGHADDSLAGVGCGSWAHRRVC